jgi:hypothetical protein
MTVGAGVSQTIKGEKSSISLGVDYTNLQPYFQLSPRRFEMNKYPESIGLTLVARQKFWGRWNAQTFQHILRNSIRTKIPDLTVPGSMSNISIENKNNYTNLSTPINWAKDGT